MLLGTAGLSLAQQALLVQVPANLTIAKRMRLRHPVVAAQDCNLLVHP